jgi:hypothetical protein
MAKLSVLQKQIKQAFSLEQLEQLFVPPEEISNYLKFQIVPVEILVKALWNYKEENEELSGKLEQNIKRNGQVENIQIRELDTGYYEIINGNHRYDNVISLGRKFVIVFNHGKISQAEAMRIAIETNESGFEPNTIKLADRIHEILQVFTLEDLVSTMPYTQDQLENYDKLLSFDWGQFNNNDNFGLGGGSEPDQNKSLELKITEETFNLWNKWKDKIKELFSIDNEGLIFEFAIINALAIPDNQLKKEGA